MKMNREEQTFDVVNKPRHYNRDGAIECFDEIAMILTEEQLKGYILGNVWKYRYRAMGKNGDEDLRKSDWYMAKYKELFFEEEEEEEEEDEDFNWDEF